MPTEFNGVEKTPATIQPKGRTGLSASDKLRLIYLTGTEDPRAPRDKRAWTGERTESSG